VTCDMGRVLRLGGRDITLFPCSCFVTSHRASFRLLTVAVLALCDARDGIHNHRRRQEHSGKLHIPLLHFLHSICTAVDATV